MGLLSKLRVHPDGFNARGGGHCATRYLTDALDFTADSGLPRMGCSVAVAAANVGGTVRSTHAVPVRKVPALTWSKRRHVDLCRTQTAICR
jgi:hypothetical protein